MRKQVIVVAVLAVIGNVLYFSNPEDSTAQYAGAIVGMLGVFYALPVIFPNSFLRLRLRCRR
jgi:hypothetical protein